MLIRTYWKNTLRSVYLLYIKLFLTTQCRLFVQINLHCDYKCTFKIFGAVKKIIFLIYIFFTSEFVMLLKYV